MPSSNARLPMENLKTAEDSQMIQFVVNSATGLLHNLGQILIFYAFIWTIEFIHF